MRIPNTSLSLTYSKMLLLSSTKCRIAAKKEIGSTHDDGRQENLSGALPDYGGTPISDVTVPQPDSGVKRSDRDQDTNSNRALLASAFENLAQYPDEATAIQRYKAAVDRLDAEQRKLSEIRGQIKELSFSKVPKDTKKIKTFQFEANKIANRINTYDRQLLKLSAAKPLQGVLQHEKKLAYKRAERKLKIYMLGEKINTILEKHLEIILEKIKKIPQILENPVLILESQNTGRRGSNTRMVVFGSVKAKNDLPITVILDLRAVENNLVIADMQKVTSAYTKDNNPVPFIRKSNALYVDKKRATSLEAQSSSQWLEKLQGYDSNVIIHKTSASVKLSDRDYSYEALISKPDMPVTLLDDNVPKNRADVVAQAKKGTGCAQCAQSFKAPLPIPLSVYPPRPILSTSVPLVGTQEIASPDRLGRGHFQNFT